MDDSARFQQEEVTLRDGSCVTLRAVVPTDAEGLRRLFHRLSPESVYFRFLEARKDLPLEQAQRFATVDHVHSMAILAVAATEDEPDAEPIVGVARYGPASAEESQLVEAAVVVQDDYQGRGLGTLLLLRLVSYARDQGIHGLQATIHQSNAKILGFIRKSGLPAKRKLSGGVWEIVVELQTLPDPPPSEA
jgi:GNAT superfamily N-acetyltransferase